MRCRATEHALRLRREMRALEARQVCLSQVCFTLLFLSLSLSLSFCLSLSFLLDLHAEPNGRACVRNSMEEL